MENNMVMHVEKVLEDPVIVITNSFRPGKKFWTFREDYDDIFNQTVVIVCLELEWQMGLYASLLF